MMRQERMFLIRLFPARNHIRHFHNAVCIFAIGGGHTDRFETILEGRIQPRDCELIRWRIICQSGNGENIIAGKFIDEMCNARDIA